MFGRHIFSDAITAALDEIESFFLTYHDKTSKALCPA